MKIKRDEDKKKKKLTPEEKELQDLKRAKNIGLLALGASPVLLGLNRLSERKDSKASDPNFHDQPKDRRILKASGIGLGILGAGVHGVSAVKYRKLKNKLKKQQEEDDNTKEEK